MANFAEIIKEYRRESGLSLNDLSPMSSRRDPYRRDTPANRRDAEWVADLIDQHITTETVHPRGLHYVLVSTQPAKPNGETYHNTEDDWDWLCNALSGARWLGMVDFGRIADNRNAPPLIRLPQGAEIAIEAMPEIEIPDADEFEPRVVVYRSDAGDDAAFWWKQQAYTIIFVGEKASLAPVIEPVALEVNAGVFLPTGDLSDTLLWQIVQMIEDCERPAVIFYLSDFDPSGFSMPKALARKIQAMSDLEHLTQAVTVHATALTFEQCESLDLPSTPIKVTDKRGPAWVAATGREQTEIDALAALDPEALREILREATAPYFDPGLKDRVLEVVHKYQREQTAALADQIGPERMGEIRDQIAERLVDAEGAIEDLRRATAIDADQFDLDELILPDAILPPRGDEPLLDPDDSWLEQTARLMARKKFEV